MILDSGCSILDARYWILDTDHLHIRTGQIVIENRVSNIEYQLVIATRPPTARNQQPAAISLSFPQTPLTIPAFLW